VGKNVAVFVDVANIFYAAKAAGVDIDYVTLLKSATAGRDLVRAYAYTGLDPENENQRNFHSFLARHGYKVVSKDIRKYGDGKVKANLDIELVVDMMKTARNLDIAIVVSGDGDFAPAIRAVQEQGVRVEVISFRGNTSSDLIEVADQFTDIIQLARVDKTSSRSGRRVAGDDEDLSMTEVPDKQTEGTGAGRGRGGRGRDRGRGREVEPAARGRRGEPAVAVTSSGAPLVVLPGERLSKVAPAASATEAGEAPEDELDETTIEANGAGPIDSVEGEDGEHRRRRRRGGRGRGRGRGRGEGVEVEAAREPREERSAEATPFDALDAREDEFVAAPRGPRPTPFGSVWDSQLGVPSQAPAASGLGSLSDDEDFEEPEIPEYLIAERKNRGRGQGQGQGRGGRGVRSGYAAAIERERYGRGGGGGGINRYPDVSGRERQRDAGYGRQERPARHERPERHERPAAQTGSEPWSEVPPELEAMLRAQLSSRPSGGQAPAQAERSRRGAPSITELEAAEVFVDESATKEAAPASGAVTERKTTGPVAAEPEAAAPRRRTTRRRTTAETAATEAAAEAAPATGEAEPAAEAPAPRRRPTRRTTAATSGESASGGAEASAPAADAEAPATTTRRRTTRRTAVAADASTAETPAAEGASDAPEGEAPKRRTTRRRTTASTETPEA